MSIADASHHHQLQIGQYAKMADMRERAVKAILAFQPDERPDTRRSQKLPKIVCQRPRKLAKTV